MASSTGSGFWSFARQERRHNGGGGRDRRRATAELFAREGARLVLADINVDGLSTLRESLANSDR